MNQFCLKAENAMRKWMRPVVLLLLGIGIASGLVAGEETPDKLNMAALDRLEIAVNTTSTASFRALGHEVFHASPGSKTTVLYQQLADPVAREQGFVYRRADYFHTTPADAVPAPGTASRSMVMNNDGVYAVSGKKALKMDAGDVYWLPPFDFDHLVTESMERVDYNGTACWRVVLRLGENHTLYPLGAGKIEAFIDEKRDFIYAWTMYDRKDAPLKTMDFGNVDFARPPTPRAFALPDGLNVKQAAPEEKLNSAMLAELEKVELPAAQQKLLEELNAAIRKSLTVNFKSVVKTTDAQETSRYRILYQFHDPDDNFTFQRVDFVPPRLNEQMESEMEIDDSLIPQSNRRNRLGYYNIHYDGAAIKNAFVRSIWYAWYIFEIAPASPVEGNFSIARRPIEYNGFPCWEYVAKGDIKVMSETAKAASMRFVAMRDNDFVCLWEQFDRNGRITKRISLGIPDFSFPVAEDLFSIADGIEIHEAHTDDEYKAALAKIEEKYYFGPMRRAKRFEGLGDWCRRAPGRLLAFIMELNPVYLLIPAVVCIPAVMVIKRNGINKSPLRGDDRASARRSSARRR